jgi:hypothetical protein
MAGWGGYGGLVFGISVFFGDPDAKGTSPSVTAANDPFGWGYAECCSPEEGFASTGNMLCGVWFLRSHFRLGLGYRGFSSLT